ncbi:unnamed protein product, partial [Adineta ricciae]
LIASMQLFRAQLASSQALTIVGGFFWFISFHFTINGYKQFRNEYVRAKLSSANLS